MLWLSSTDIVGLLMRLEQMNFEVWHMILLFFNVFSVLEGTFKEFNLDF